MSVKVRPGRVRPHIGAPRSLVLASLFLAACGADPATSSDPTAADNASSSGGGKSGSSSSSSGDTSGSSSGAGSSSGSSSGDPSGIVADLRADTNRDGVISFTDASDDDGEDVWDKDHGAIFLANIDDDEKACSTAGLDDLDLPKCNDAADDKLNGDDDALDLARLKTKPWSGVTKGATGTIGWTSPDRVRLFRVSGTSFDVVESGTKLTEDDLKNGVELAIEGKDIVRDDTWDGYVDFTFQVDAGGKSATDKVRMRIAPLMTYHHLLPAEQTWVSVMNNQGNKDMRADLATALTAAGLPPVNGVTTDDSWNQDYFETGFMSMPEAGGKQHVIRVNIRSANVFNEKSATNPLRQAGRVVWDLRGKDVAGIQQFHLQRTSDEQNADSTNSFGNLETVPPYSFGGQDYPLGRIIRGKTATFGPDTTFIAMMEAQKVQPPIYIDTSWLLVGHVDETISFVKAPGSARGWVMLVNDATMAKTMFQTQANAGKGSTALFVGKTWDNGQSAQTTIDGVLSDTDVMSASAEAVVEVQGQIDKIKSETGLTDDELVKIPFLHEHVDGYSLAYQPGMVNGIYISDTHFVAPDPHGPVINGQDIFKKAMTDALAPYGVTVHFAEDWDNYHREEGEVHCGTNATRQIPTVKWWETGR